MGVFHVDLTLSNIAERTRKATVERTLVDTGSELTWVPKVTLEEIGVVREKKDLAFVMANGQQITRSVGFAVVYLEDRFTVDEVVFGEEGDLPLLGARTLEGLNLTVEPTRKRLVAAGPLPAASTSEST